MINTIAIVGGGLAGGAVGQTLRNEGFEGRILMFGEESYQPYDRPSLSKAALLNDELSPTEIFKAGWAEASNVEFVRDMHVRSIDPIKGNVTLDTGEVVPADRIVLATGSRARKIPLPGSHLDGVHLLRNWSDIVSLRQALKPDLKLVIIGGGLIGCEVATTATKIGAKVTILEAGEELMARILGYEVGSFCRHELMNMGVTVHLNAQVSVIDGETQVRSVHCIGGLSLDADLVLISVGGEPVKELAVAAGLVCSTGIDVDDLGMTSSPIVYAAGDVACWPLRSGGRRCLETYLNTQTQAETVAKAILGKGQSAPQVPKSWTEVAGHNIQIIGDIIGPGQQIIRPMMVPGAGIHFRIDSNGYVVAAVSVDAPSDFSAAMRFVDKQLRPDLTQLSDPAVTLRDLLRTTK